MYSRLSRLALQAAILGVPLLLNACAIGAGLGLTNRSSSAPQVPPEPETHELERGRASYYSNKLAGRKTANGERYNPRAFSAAHRSLPFGTYVRVRHTATKKEVVVRINDRGPFTSGRIIDLSMRAASELGIVGDGLADVSISIACAIDGDCREFVK